MDELDMRIKEACERVSQELIDEINWDPEPVEFSPEFEQRMKETFPFLYKDEK